MSRGLLRGRSNGRGSAVGTFGEEAEETLKARFGAGVDVFGHLVIHERVVFVPDKPSGVTDLGDGTDAIGIVGSAAMPDLIVKDDDATGGTGTRHDAIGPLALVRVGWARAFDEMRAANAFRGTEVRSVDIGKVIVGGEEEAGKFDVVRGSPWVTR